MKILDKLFGKKKRKLREEFLINEYDKGRFIQVDNGINNKEYLSSKKEMEEKVEDEYPKNE